MNNQITLNWYFTALTCLFVIVNFPSLVVNQQFESDVFKVNVILSNDITLKCVSPSHVADLLSVTSWVDSEGNTYTDGDSYGNISHLCLYLIQWVWKHEVKSFWNLSTAYLLHNIRIMLFVLLLKWLVTPVWKLDIRHHWYII